MRITPAGQIIITYAQEALSATQRRTYDLDTQPRADPHQSGRHRIRVVLLAIGEGATISQFGGLQAATAMVGFKDITAHTASKHAVISLTKAAIL